MLPSSSEKNEYVGDNKVVVGAEFARRCDGVDSRQLSTNQALRRRLGIPLFDEPAVLIRSRTAADVIVAGRLQRAQRRQRAFYVTSKMTAMVHERLIPGRPGHLLRSARIMDRVRGASELVVPLLYESGEAAFTEWVVEELLEGKHPTREEYLTVANKLALGLVSMHAKTGVQPRPLSSFQTQGLVDALAELAELPQVGMGRYDVERIREQAQRMLTRDVDVLVGYCHGDPVLGNTLIMPDGRLGLIDWEHAAERPIAHDFAKLVTGNFLGDGVVELVDAEMSKIGVRMTMPWRHQLAFAITSLLRDWRAQRERARRSDRVANHDRVLRRRLGMAVKLLNVS